MRRLNCTGTLILLAAALGGCGGDSPQPKSESVAEIPWAAVERRGLDIAVTAEATVEAVRQSTVAAQVSGRIIEVRFDVGDRVKQGEVIVRIDERVASSAVAASAAQVAEAEAALRNARAEFERSRELASRKFISQAALDRVEAEYRAAQARVTALLAGAGQAATERSFATIVAPYSGIVSARHVEVGEMATPGKPLMTGFDPATLRVSATLPLAQAAAVKPDTRARVELPSINRWVDAARLTLVPSADPRTHTTEVRLALPTLPADMKGIYPGTFARVHFVIGREERLVVPRVAVLRRSELTAVYVLDASGGVQLRQVRLGAAGDEQFIEVLAGLKAGERVALEPVKAGIERLRG
jgi:RND family efflux transporter MFP subunit